MLSFVGARVPHFFKFSKQMTIILLSSYGYPETSVIQKINFSVPPHSPKKMQSKTRLKAKAQSLVRSSASGELQRPPPQGDGGVTGRCRLGHGEGSERRFPSSRTSKPRPGKAPPRCSGSWETRPSPRKGLPGRMLVQDETRLWDSGPGEPRASTVQPQVRGPLRPSSPGPWLRWGRLRPLRVAGLSAFRIPVTTGGKRPRPGPVFVGLEASGGAFSLASPGCRGHRLREGRGAGQVDSHLRACASRPGSGPSVGRGMQWLRARHAEAPSSCSGV